MSVGHRGKKCGWILVSILCLYLPTSFAIDYISPSNWYVNGGIGFLIPNLSHHSTTVFNGSTTQNPQDIYSIKPSAAPILALEGGYRWTRLSDWFHTFTLSLNYRYLMAMKVKGTVDQYSDPSKINYNYNLTLASHVLSAVAKLNIYRFNHFAPFISLGLGEAFTLVDNYTEEAQGDVQPRISPNFSSNALNTVFSEGVGADYIFNRKWSMSLSYEYDDWGKIKPSKGSSTWSNSSLALGTLTSSAILLGIHYQLPE